MYDLVLVHHILYSNSLMFDLVLDLYTYMNTISYNKTFYSLCNHNDQSQIRSFSLVVDNKIIVMKAK